MQLSSSSLFLSCIATAVASALERIMRDTSTILWNEQWLSPDHWAEWQNQH